MPSKALLPPILAACGALLLCACRTAPGAPSPAPHALEPAADPDSRRLDLLSQASGEEGDLLQAAVRHDDFGGSLQMGEAIEAYADGEELRSLLLAQAAVGADPGNGARRKLLETLEAKTGLTADPEGMLPLKALVHLELKRADEHFFGERFGAALQACRRALLLSPKEHEGWMRLGSTHYALGEMDRAKAAYLRARALDPKDAHLERFLLERGWLPNRP